LSDILGVEGADPTSIGKYSERDDLWGWGV